MPQFYTLDEAARVLGTTADDLKKMADRNEVRAFRDRGTMRFRAPEIDEMARRRGRGSDPELQLGDNAAPPKGSSSGKPAKATPEVFDFNLPAEDSDQVEIGQELRLEAGSSKSGKGSSKSGRKLGGAKSPTPKPGSDSDVRLVPDGSDVDFHVASDSDVKMVEEPAPVPPSTPPKRKSGSSKSRLDSGVQMVPLHTQGDSDVKLSDQGPESGVSLGKQSGKTPSDSDVRLEGSGPAKGSDDSLLTEEIDLDAELRKAAEADKSKGTKQRKSKAKPPSAPQLPTGSPFELSASDLDVPASKGKKSTDSSSDFELAPAKATDPSSGDIPLDPSSSSDEINLGKLTGSGEKSGINLKDPADSGISLEQEGSSEELEFELGLESEATPKPAKGKGKPGAPAAPAAEAPDSDSGFELTLDEEPAADSSPVDSDSEFELTLDSEGSDPEGSPVESDSSPVDSDSEFELTLDDSGGLAVDNEPSQSEDEKDIFETDFEVPSLEDESGSQAVALEGSDTDLESSDFDLALGDEDIAAEDESGSQVVALEDEGEVDEAAETVARSSRRRGAPVLAEDSGEVEELFDVEGGGAEAEEEMAAARTAAVAGPAAEWGPLPALMMIPCVIVLFLVSLMSYELVRRDGTNNPNTLTKAIAGVFGYSDANK